MADGIEVESSAGRHELLAGSLDLLCASVMSHSDIAGLGIWSLGTFAGGDTLFKATADPYIVSRARLMLNRVTTLAVLGVHESGAHAD